MSENWVKTKILQLKKGMTKKQCIIIALDEGGQDDPDDVVTLIYDNHGDYGIVLNTLRGRCKRYDWIDTDFDFEDRVKSIARIDIKVVRKMHEMEEDRSPKNAQRHVGIELEFISRLSKPELVMALAKAKLENYVTVKEDGSIDSDENYEYAHEVCILATEKNYSSIVKKVCKAVQAYSTVNKSCGMHVHLDMRTRNVDQAYASLFEAQGILYAMCPDSRLEGEYSEMRTVFESVTKESKGDRFVGINKTAYITHQTIEIRIHSGTLNMDKINNWINLLIKVVDNKKIYDLNNVNICRDLKQFKKETKIRGKLSKYIDDRINAFNSDTKKTVLQLVA